MGFSQIDFKTFYAKALRFGPWLSATEFLVIYGEGRLPHSFLNRLARARHRRIQRYILPFVLAALADETPVPVPKKLVSDAIWVCWFQGEENMPPITKLCLSHIREYCGSHPVVLLDAGNYLDYVVIPEHIKRLYKEGKLSNAVYSDILRSNLLSQQGGYWMDSSLLPTAPIPDEAFSLPIWSVKIPETGNYVSRCRWCGFSIATRKHSPFATAAARSMHNYFAATETQIDYFLIDHVIDLLYQLQPGTREAIDALPVSNPHLHSLARKLCEPYDAAKFAALTADTQLFKLNWKLYSTEELTANPHNIFSILNYYCPLNFFRF